jgi:hypothetical protein
MQAVSRQFNKSTTIITGFQPNLLSMFMVLAQEVTSKSQVPAVVAETCTLTILAKFTALSA